VWRPDITRALVCVIFGRAIFQFLLIYNNQIFNIIFLKLFIIINFEMFPNPEILKSCVFAGFNLREV